MPVSTNFTVDRGLEFNKLGSVISPQEQVSLRKRRGECVTCGRKCFIKKLMRTIPINKPGQVLNGRCLICNPLEDELVTASPKKNKLSQQEARKPKQLPSRAPELSPGTLTNYDGVSESSDSTHSLQSSRDSWQGSKPQLLDSPRVDSPILFLGELHDTVSPMPNMGHKRGGGGVPDSQHNLPLHYHNNDSSNHSMHSCDGCGTSVVTHLTSTSHTQGSSQYSIPHHNDMITAGSNSYILSTARENAGMDALCQAGADFVEIIHVMRDFCDSAPVQLMGMRELSTLQLSPADIDTFLQAGAVDVICEGMRNYPMDVELQISGCRTIWNASATAVSQIAFVEAGAIDLIHMGMAQYFDDADVQEQSMATLANLAAVERNAGIMFERNVAACVVEAMKEHVENVHVQKKGCSAITNMASHNTLFKKTLMEIDGGDAVVTAMMMHPNDHFLQERALRALRNLSANCDENKVKLAQIFGIDAIVRAMQVHRDSAGVQEAGAWTLANLAGNPENKVLIGQYGGIDITILAMFVHAENEKVQEWCCRALFSLSIDQANCQLIQEIGGISAVVNAMHSHEDSVVVQEMGCAVLCNLAIDKQCKVRIVSEEALDYIVLAMVLHSTDPKVQERGCQVLLQLTIFENCKAMQASNISDLFRYAAERFPDRCSDMADRYEQAMDVFVAQYNSGSHDC